MTKTQEKEISWTKPKYGMLGWNYEEIQETIINGIKNSLSYDDSKGKILEFIGIPLSYKFNMGIFVQDLNPKVFSQEQTFGKFLSDIARYHPGRVRILSQRDSYGMAWNLGSNIELKVKENVNEAFMDAGHPIIRNWFNHDFKIEESEFVFATKKRNGKELGSMLSLYLRDSRDMTKTVVSRFGKPERDTRIEKTEEAFEKAWNYFI